MDQSKPQGRARRGDGATKGRRHEKRGGAERRHGGHRGGPDPHSRARPKGSAKDCQDEKAETAKAQTAETGASAAPRSAGGRVPAGAPPPQKGEAEPRPGTIAAAKGSAGAANYFAHGEAFRFSPRALGCLPLSNPVRRAAAFVVTAPLFKRAVLVLIIANSICLGLLDFSKVNPVSYEPETSGSWRNTVVLCLDPIFLAFYSLELLLKVVAMGFVLDRGSYLRDAGNMQDAVVVVGGILSIMPGIPSTPALQMLRCLRPLRVIAAVPRLRTQVFSLLGSVSKLLNLLVLAGFIFTVFGTMGLQLWQGLFERRCRLTPYPVHLPPSEVEQHLDMMRAYAEGDPAAVNYTLTLMTDRTLYPFCSDPPNSSAIIPLDEKAWTQATSPWATPRDCVWPMATNQTRNCNPYADWLSHSCLSWQACGSNYDRFGNPRFASPSIVRSATFVEDLTWGYVGFDSIFAALITLFEIITLEGWSGVMYRVIDAYGAIPAFVYFVAFVVLGGYLLINLVLGILAEHFREAKEGAERAHQERRKSKAKVHPRRTPTDGDDGKERQGKEKSSSTGGAGNSQPSDRDAPPRGCAKRALASCCASAPMQMLRRAGESQAVASVTRPFNVLVTSPAFDAVVMVLILANTVVMAMDSHPIDPGLDLWLENINVVLTLVFGLEMVLKLIGLGVPAYMRDPYNRFDAFVVVATLVELGINPPDLSGSEAQSNNVVVLCLLRIARVFKLARSWPSLQYLLATVGRTLRDVASFGLLLLLFLYVYALIGMQLFANRMRFDPDSGEPVPMTAPEFEQAELPRANFDNLYWAMLSCFWIATEEDWPGVMHDARRGTSWAATLYFVSIVIIGNLILVNLFVAIMLSNFEGQSAITKPVAVAKPPALAAAASSLLRAAGSGRESKEHGKRGGASGRRKVDVRSVVELARKGHKEQRGEGGPHPQDASGQGAAGQDAQASPHLDSGARPNGSAADAVRKVDTALANEAAGVRKSDPSLVKGSGLDAGSTLGDASAESKQQSSQRSPDGKSPAPGGTEDGGPQPAAPRPQPRIEGRALGLLGPQNAFRRRVYALVHSKPFDSTILACIIISSVLIGVDSPLLDPSSTLAQVLYVSDIVLTSIFTMEMLAKIVAVGLLFQRGAYLRSGWNVLDSVVVAASVMSLVLGNVSMLQALRALRTFRALRPLRVIARHDGLRVVVNTLLRSLPAVFNVLLVCFIIFTSFAIAGVSFFKGRLSTCAGPVFDGLSSAQGALLAKPVPYADLNAAQQSWVPGATYEGATSKAVCEWFGAEWKRAIPESFDSYPSAMVALFALSTTEGWQSVMFAGIDGTGIDMQPQRDHAPAMALFFVLFLVVGAFFMINLFVGAVVETYNSLCQEEEGAALLTDGQREWVRVQEIMVRIKPFRRTRRPQGWRGRLFDVVTHPRFEWTIMVCILLNTLVLAVNHFGEPQVVTDITGAINNVFAFIFTLEAILKIVALRKGYFREAWNLFDFVIVVGTATGLVIQWVTGVSVGTVGTVVRTFRVGRILRLVNRAETLNTLLNALFLALPGLGNIVALLLLVIFIFAVIGVQLFATVELGDELNQQFNFQSFWLAALFLVRAITGEDWNSVMYDMARDRKGCVDSPSYDPNVCAFVDREGCTPINGCGSNLAFPYMVLYVIIASFIMLNLFVAIVMDSFQTSTDDQDGMLTEQQFRAFATHWTQFDPKATGFLSATELNKFLQKLPPPMGLAHGLSPSRVMLQSAVKDLHLPTYADPTSGRAMVFFPDVALALSRRVVAEVVGGDDASLDPPLGHTMRGRLQSKLAAIKRKSEAHVNDHGLSQILAACVVDTAYRAAKFRALAQNRHWPPRSAPSDLSGDTRRAAREDRRGRKTGKHSGAGKSGSRERSRRNARSTHRDESEAKSHARRHRTRALVGEDTASLASRRRHKPSSRRHRDNDTASRASRRRHKSSSRHSRPRDEDDATSQASRRRR